MEAFKRQLKFQVFDMKKVCLPLMVILLLVNLIFYIEVYTTGANIGVMKGSDLNIAATNIFFIAIFMVVFDMKMYQVNFPFSIGFSISRRDFYKSSMIVNSLICLLMSILEGICLKLDVYIVKAMGKSPLKQLGYINLQGDNVFSIIMNLFVISMIFLAVVNIFAIFTYTLSYKFWIGILLAIIFIESISVIRNGRNLFVSYIFKYNGLLLFSIKIIVLTALLYGIGWLVVRKMNIRSIK